ncbi:carboxyl-terminal peptidase (DUF239) [Arabidopsis thaliana]|uniref:At3g48230 n=2 Tax=Arabidopsis thaliana TaxID=3702 RepID=Q8GX31_ARATH|nr:carboxyl-terminal peptidase (DUF239) [Arabidopsis thaliana]AAO63385.1 At3g48230 [Arabidopsis thaliana]AEE78387.1 carboxyl-terminal peptidase (DUF239) [Arabidopsis thaliana]BAC43073.1 unknown protein [Arabidopsis thaliana]|eukprot:NP_190406.2 carboxyl-terminal peptidase (DUF239) [Arabidopsis thaliana]
MIFSIIMAVLLAQASSLPKKTVQSSDGDIVDCFDVRDQPSLDHPLLQNHEIQGAPATGLPYMINKAGKRRVWQVWNQNGTSCPDETIPIRRSVVGAKRFKKKHWTDVRVNRRTVPYAAEEGHEYAIGEVVYLRGIYGTVATMNVWNPSVEHGTNEFSLSQIWLVAGHYNDSDLNTVEAGWQVFPDHYHDSQPRLFVYWTKDTYQKTGCLNLECPGFVQVTSEFAIGSAFSPTSSYGGSQYDITMYIWKDTKDGNWWLSIDSSVIGYWPARLFTHLAHGPATLVQWGGEIVNSRSYGQHTTTQMGSGHFAEEGFGKAGSFRNLKIIDYLSYMQPVQEFILQTKNPTCYTAIKGYSEEWGSHFYYGGPGYNALCP